MRTLELARGPSASSDPCMSWHGKRPSDLMCRHEAGVEAAAVLVVLAPCVANAEPCHGRFVAALELAALGMGAAPGALDEDWPRAPSVPAAASAATQILVFARQPELRSSSGMWQRMECPATGLCHGGVSVSQIAPSFLGHLRWKGHPRKGGSRSTTSSTVSIGAASGSGSRTAPSKTFV